MIQKKIKKIEGVRESEREREREREMLQNSLLNETQKIIPFSIM
jgi:hypothetical protein